MIMKYDYDFTLITATCALALLPLLGAGCMPQSAAGRSEEIAPAPTNAASLAPSGGVGEPALTVTMDDLGKTIRLGVGDEFLLKLPGTYEWTSQTSDASVLATDFGVRVAHGTQMTYRTFKPGKVALTAQGDAPCLKDQPACATPSEFFKVDFLVTP